MLLLLQTLHLCAGALPAPPPVYSLVKFAGVRNYIVGTWEQADLESCADLNLPCADISSYLPEPMDHAADGFGTHDYYVSGAGCSTGRDVGKGCRCKMVVIRGREGSGRG